MSGFEEDPTWDEMYHIFIIGNNILNDDDLDVYDNIRKIRIFVIVPSAPEMNFTPNFSACFSSASRDILTVCRMI